MSEKTRSDGAQKKRRSPVERALVWGGIGILALVVVWEAWARFGYSRTLSRWQDAMVAAERGNGSSALTLADAQRMVSGSATKSMPERQGSFQVITYRWNSLFGRNYAISMSVTRGEAPEVVGLQTADAPEDEEPPEAVPMVAEQSSGEPQAARSSSNDKNVAEKPSQTQEERSTESVAEQAQKSSGPAPGPLAGVAGFIMGSMDRDGDGKLSPDEAPEKIRPYFSRLDQNGDRLLDYDEVYTARSIEEMEAEQQRSPETSASNEPQ